ISGIKYTDVNGLDGNTSIGGDDTAGTPEIGRASCRDDWKDTALNVGVVDEGELTKLATTENNATTCAWSFGNLGPLGAGEKYYVKEVGETGWSQTFGTAGDISTPTSATDRSDCSSDMFTYYTISGIKYTDVNGLDGNTSIGGDDTAGTP